MPYLAFDLDALEKAPNVARASHITEDAAIAGMARMWRHCWREKTDVVDGTALEGFFGADTSKAMVTFRLLEPSEGAFRVRGAKRYLRIRKAQSEGGKKAVAAGNLKRGNQQNSPRSPGDRAGEDLETLPSSGPGLTASSEQRAANTKDLSSAAPSVSFVPDAAEAERQMRPDEAGAYSSTGLGFCGWWNPAKMQAGMTAEVFNIAETAQWADRCFAEVGERFWIAADDFLHDKYWRQKGCPLAVFRRDDDVGWRTRANDTPPPKRVRQ